MLLRDRKRWRIKQRDELDEQKCTQKIGILPGPTKKWRIKRIDELNDDELDEFYCIRDLTVNIDANYTTYLTALAVPAILVSTSYGPYYAVFVLRCAWSGR